MNGPVNGALFLNGPPLPFWGALLTPPPPAELKTQLSQGRGQGAGEGMGGGRNDGPDVCPRFRL